MTNVGTQGGNPAGLKKKGHFIEFKITDKNTGEPVKGVTVNVSYSDQSKNSLGTWKSGRAHFENIPDGACDLLDCRKGLVLMEEKETCRLKEGDSLHSIAERERGNGNDISWQDIAAFNWGDGARDLAVANEHMRDLFGCIHYDKLKGCLIYSAKEGMTHSLVIPKKIERKSLAIDRVHEIKVNNGPTSRQFLACTRLPNITFEPMRSFIRPNAASYLKKIVESAKEHPGSMFMLFGHADKVGTDEFNKSLSERRARSAYALLTKNPSAWLTYYKDGIDPDNEGWGIKNVQVILNFLNPDARLDITNTLDPRTGAELEKYVKPAWQYECGEKVITEAALKSVFRIYMDRLVNGTNLSESDFFGLRHVGCGKFNPLVEMETAHEDNRRVTFFLFDQERLPVMPCSNSGMDPCRTQAGCKNPDEKPFRYNPSFTCSFYDGIARGCECEASVPDIISIDSHMHFMSGHCTPLPLIWNQLPNLPGKKKINRTKLDWAGKNILQFIPTQGGNAGITIMQQKATLEIADIGFNNNTESHRKLHPNFKAAGKNRELYTPMIAMPMDMSYAHYDGYKALPVYYKLLKKPYFMQYITTTETGTVQVKTVLWPDNICENTKDFATVANAKKQFGEDVVSRTLNYEEYHSKNGKEGFYFYFERFSVLTEDQVKEMDDQKIDLSHQMNDKIPIWLPLQETDLFQDWAAQKEDTLVTAIKYPLQYLAFYHYDPRRWSVLENGGTAVPRDEAADRPYFTPPGNWDEPFKEIATADKPGTFIGFKMYTALGYKPLDPKLSGTLNAFYGRCQEENIPIMCHCSPSGMWSHDKDHYFNSGSSSHKDNYGYKDRKWYTLWFWSKKEYQADVGFYDAFVRPTAWETQVLSKYPDLKLCLAHFGGGSTEWAAWKNDTESKIRLYKKIKINETRNSNITVTPEEKDVLIASYFNRYENPAERTYKGKKTLPKWYYDHDADTGLSEDLWSKL